MSLISDFRVRISPKSTIRASVVGELPVVTNEVLASALAWRTLRLSCLTEHFADLWSGTQKQARRVGSPWAGGHSYADRGELHLAPDVWSLDVPLRRDSDRRQALLEIDAIVALAVGVTADQLCSIYRMQFAVLYKYDQGTSTYDARGRLVPLSVLAVWRRKGNRMTADESTATNSTGNTYSYVLPFVTLDREGDMRRAYAHFEQLLKERE
jgi:hypothetical protein